MATVAPAMEGGPSSSTSSSSSSSSVDASGSAAAAPGSAPASAPAPAPTVTPTAAGAFSSPAEREAWILYMRSLFTPPEMRRPDGRLDQEYFRPTLAQDDRVRWSDVFQATLVTAVGECGIGAWKDMHTRFLPEFEESELVVRAGIGCFQFLAGKKKKRKKKRKEK
jgi:hypothetical protein